MNDYNDSDKPNYKLESKERGEVNWVSMMILQKEDTRNSVKAGKAVILLPV